MTTSPRLVELKTRRLSTWIRNLFGNQTAMHPATAGCRVRRSSRDKGQDPLPLAPIFLGRRGFGFLRRLVPQMPDSVLRFVVFPTCGVPARKQCKA